MAHSSLRSVSANGRSQVSPIPLLATFSSMPFYVAAMTATESAAAFRLLSTNGGGRTPHKHSFKTKYTPAPSSALNAAVLLLASALHFI